MENILIFKTASPDVMEKLFEHISDTKAHKFCAVQSSAVEHYRSKHSELSLIDIGKESFYDLSDDVIAELSARHYSGIYAPTSGFNAKHFGNIMEIVSGISYDKLLFFNREGQINEVRRMSKFKETLCAGYIRVFSKLYRMTRR